MQDSLEIYCLIIPLTAPSVLLSLALPAVTSLLDPLWYRNYHLEQPPYIFLLLFSDPKLSISYS